VCFVSVLCLPFNCIEHGGHLGDTTQALARWWHPVAWSEALDVLHWVVCPTLYRHVYMAIKIARDLPALFVVTHLLVPTTIAKLHSNG